MKGWTKVVVIGLFARLPAKLAAFFVVPFIDRQNNPIWGNSWTDDLSYWNIAVRNGAYNLSRKEMPKYLNWSNTADLTLEKRDGFQWRRCESLDGEYVSFRMTWGKPRASKGKREFYVGWKMRPDFEDNTMALTFFQLRVW